MPATREQAIEALFSRLTGAYAFSAATRRLASPETLAAGRRLGAGPRRPPRGLSPGRRPRPRRAASSPRWRSPMSTSGATRTLFPTRS